MNSLDALCVGNATIDAFVLLKPSDKVNFDKFSNSIALPLGEKIPVGEYVFSLGGNACNVSVGLSRLGHHSGLCTEIGSDEFSDKITNSLNSEGVDRTFVKRNQNQKPFFNIILTFEGERTIFDEDKDFEELEMPETNSRLIYLTSVHRNWQILYEKAFNLNKESIFAFNPGSKQINENLDDILRILPNIDFLFLNLGEAQKIAKDTDPDIKVILKKIKTWGVKTVLVTDGINGSYAISEHSDIFQISPVTKEKPVERTGAGDSYAAGFLYGILNRHSVNESMRFGAINADSVIKKVGAQTGLLKKEEMEQKSKELAAFSAVKI